MQFILLHLKQSLAFARLTSQLQPYFFRERNFSSLAISMPPPFAKVIE